MPKPFEQTDLTKQFLEQADKLIKDGTVKDYTVLATSIKYDKTSLSNVVKNRRNIPYTKYLKFVEVYKLKTGNHANDDYQAKYYRLLEKREEESSLDDVWEAVQVNQRLLAELYEHLIADSKKDKTLREVSQRARSKGNGVS